MTHNAPRYRLRPPTKADLEALATERERHRTQGCRLFDDKFAKCTCPPAEEQPR